MQTESLATPSWLRWLAGPLVWAAHFLVVYASESVLCTRGAGAGAHLTLIALATVAGLAVLFAAFVSRRRALAVSAANDPSVTFMEQVAAALSLLGGLAIIWTALPATLLSSCTLPS
jgi:hypothetical protein